MVLARHNDLTPQHLYPELADPGYANDTVEADGGTVTAFWPDEESAALIERRAMLANS